MPYSGSGVFTIINTFVPGTVILSSAVNQNYSDIATGLSTAILKDGTQILTANIPMAGFKLTGLAAGSNPNDSVRFNQIIVPSSPNTWSGAQTFNGNNIYGGTSAFNGNVTLGASAAAIFGSTATFNSTSSFTGAATFSLTTAGTSPITIVSTDAGAAAGPLLTITRNSASPANSDVLGSILFTGNNASAAAKTYGSIKTTITDVTAGSEDATLTIGTIIAGTVTDVAKFTQGLQLGGPTGGDKGAGTLNATGIYINNVAVQAGTIVASVKQQTFVASGTYTPSTGMIYAIIQGVGGGGGSGGRSASTGTSGSGGGADFSSKLVTAADIGASKTVTIGAGGTAGGTSDGNGGAGGDSSVGTLMIAKGGSGGAGADGGNDGAGGVAGTGDYSIPGQAAIVQTGGDSIWGFGARSSGTSAAVAGHNYGGGASGTAASGTNKAGAAGAPGIIYVTEYCTQ